MQGLTTMYRKWHHLALFIPKGCSSNVRMTSTTTIVLVQVSALVAKPESAIRTPL